MTDERGIAQLLMAAVLLGSALALGGADAPVLLVLSLVANVALVLVIRRGRGMRFHGRATVALGVGIGLTLVALLQVLPLPRSIVTLVAPHSAAVWDRALEPFGDTAGMACISLDPTATKIEAARQMLYIATFVGVAALSSRRGGATFFERSLIVSSVLITLVALLHTVAAVDKVYGFYAPRTGVGIIAPLLNTNHLAAYANIGLVLAGASMVSARPCANRVLLGVVVLFLVGAQVWFASRGAVGVLLLVVVALAVTRLRKGPPRFLAPLALGVAGVVMLVLAASPDSIRGLLDTDVSKLGLTRAVFLRMVPASPWLGVGRGAFESTFPAFREGTSYIVWTHPENIVAQWASEWGLPVSIAAFVGYGYALRPPRIGSDDRMLGPWLAISATVLHNLVDFNLETPAVALAVTACAAMLVRRDVESQESSVPLRRAGLRPLGIVLVGLSLFCGGLTVLAGRELVDDRLALLRITAPSSSPQGAFDAELRGAMRRHPAEPYFPYLAAERARLSNGDNVVAWAGRCLERAPVYPPAHLVLARYFRLRSASQSRLEYRLTAEQENGAPVVREVLPLVTGFDEAMELAPANASSSPFLEEVAVAVALKLPATRARVDAELLRRDPEATGPLLRRSHDALLDVRDASWCLEELPSCVQAALTYALLAQHAAPTKCAPYSDYAGVLQWIGDVSGALSLLGSAAGQVEDPADCLETTASIATAAGQYDLATAAIDRIARTPCTTGVPCVENLLRAAAIERERGGQTRSIVFLRQAAERSPDDRLTLERLAAGAAAAGLHAEAATAYDRLATLTGDAGYRASAARERSQLYGP